MNICVFCSANEIAEIYTKPADKLATLIGSGGHTLIWGGSDKGVMKIMASGVQKAGGKIVGISMEILREDARLDADEMIITKTLAERKALLLKRSDVIVVLVGGLGTIDEMTEILELKKHKVHEKPVVILNTDNFYEGLKTQFERMGAEGFLPRPLKELIYFADTPEEAIDYLTRAFKDHENTGKPL